MNRAEAAGDMVAIRGRVSIERAYLLSTRVISFLKGYVTNMANVRKIVFILT